ncbi:MAG: cytoplasmic protein [Deltaproteobacteria bacterium]|nr:cytoplasmic protein [Deltaproteobacteria bacterium]
MATHTHDFVETYKGLVGYGSDRETDEKTVMYYLQKLSDDKLVATMTSRMTDEELQELFDLVGSLLKRHLSEAEYHSLFLREGDRASK